MAETNRTAIRIAKEPSFATAPGNPVYKQVRFNSESIVYTPTTETSNEIDPTRQISDLIRTGYESGGDLNSEFSIENLDIVMEGAMCNPWLRQPEVFNGPGWEYGASATRITAVSGTAITVAATSVLSGSLNNSPAGVFVSGMLIRNTGYGVPANNGLFPVTGNTATTIIATGLSAEAAPPATARTKVVGVQGAAGDITAVTAGGAALVSTALNWTTMGLVVGQWVKISAEGGAFSYGTAANNGWARVSGITATRLSFDIAPPGFAADTGAGKTIRVFFGDTIRNGVTPFSYRIEKEYNLASGQRFIYAFGQEVNTINVAAETRAVVTTTVGFLGSAATPPGARDAGAVTEGPNTNSVLDSSNGVAFTNEGGVPTAAPNFLSSFGFTLENNLRAQAAIGSAGAVGIGLGRSNLTGTLNFYFGDETKLGALISGTPSSFAIGFRDQASFRGEVWDIPRIKYSAGVPEITGTDADLFTPLGFQALRDIAGGRDYTVMVSRFDYVA